MVTIKQKNRLIKIHPKVGIISFTLFFLFSFPLESFSNENDSSKSNKADSNNTAIINPFYKVKTPEDLRPIPNQKIDDQEKKLNLARNPFSSIQANSEDGNFIFSQNIEFTGIARVGKENVVFADTNNGLSFLKVGSDLGNGYSISEINLKESIINITNGILSYKVDFKKK